MSTLEPLERKHSSSTNAPTGPTIMPTDIFEHNLSFHPMEDPILTSSKDTLITLVGESTKWFVSSNSFSALSSVDDVEELILYVSGKDDSMKSSYDPIVNINIYQRMARLRVDLELFPPKGSNPQIKGSTYKKKKHTFNGFFPFQLTPFVSFINDYYFI